ncbi:MAG: protein translocase subunit SecF, partial [Myxococcota bacterium]|nr:protein translocase subunit SecF [Myxococcota bacterium]
HPGQYIIRVREVSAIDEGRASAIERAVRQALGEVRLENFSISPGGDKITVRLGASVEADALRNAVEQAGVRVRGANAFGRPEDHRYEIHLAGVAERILEQLRQRLGEKAPSEPLRVEWMGPKAGAQLRDAAIQAILYALAFIMVYVAFRFDLRFAPGGVVALLHDAIVTLGVYNALQKEVNL